MKKKWLMAGLALLLSAGLGAGAELWGQTGVNLQHNAYTPMGRRLTSDLVTNELERRLRFSPQNEAALWNTGYDFYRNFPQNQDTALAIKDGFLRARADNAEQRQILTKAAIYWEKIYLYGKGNVPVGQDFSDQGRIYYGSKAKFSTMGMRPSGSRHKGFPSHDWPGRFIGRRAPYQGKADNPYPGKYYPGAYPP